MPLTTYLQTHFVDKPTIAKLADISVARLDQLISIKAIPEATYRCNGDSIRSAVFGQTPIVESITGEFFRPETVRWVVTADKASPGCEKQAVLTMLKQELVQALQTHYDSEEEIDAVILSYLPAFFNGTFGLCIADPSTGAGIVRKEELQKRLITLTADGTETSPPGVTTEALIALIKQYADASMPFSPAEYSRSSRKRLVDDLLPRINTLSTDAPFKKQ